MNAKVRHKGYRIAPPYHIQAWFNRAKRRIVTRLARELETHLAGLDHGLGVCGPDAECQSVILPEARQLLARRYGPRAKYWQ